MGLSSALFLILVGSGGTQFFGNIATSIITFMVCIGLGVSLFAMLPFCLEMGVCVTHPQSKNVSAGLIYTVAMVVAAVGNQLAGMINAGSFVSFFSILLALECSLFSRALDGIRLREGLLAKPEMKSMPYIMEQSRLLGLTR